MIVIETKAKISQTQKKHLDLVPLHHLIPLQLILNLLVAGLALLILCAHSTTHLDGFMSNRETKYKDRMSRVGLWTIIK